MNVEFSKDFEKAVRKLTGKMLLSVKEAIYEAINAENIEDLTDCKKLIGYNRTYRLRIGSLRAFFLLYIEIQDNQDTIFFQYLVSRGEAYSKKITQNLKNKDKS